MHRNRHGQRLGAISVCVCWLPGETPQDKAQATVGVQADCNLARRVELTLELDGATESADGGVGHLRKHTEGIAGS